jgi:hypothetical protein
MGTDKKAFCEKSSAVVNFFSSKVKGVCRVSNGMLTKKMDDSSLNEIQKAVFAACWITCKDVDGFKESQLVKNAQTNLDWDSSKENFKSNFENKGNMVVERSLGQMIQKIDSDLQWGRLNVDPAFKNIVNAIKNNIPSEILNKVSDSQKALDQQASDLIKGIQDKQKADEEAQKKAEQGYEEWKKNNQPAS